mgnify:CR=1 FL=1
MEQSELLKLAVEKLRRLDIPYAIVGSFASSVWGESRLTQDIDIVIDGALAQVASLCDAFPEPDFYVSREAAQEAVRLRRPFNVVHPSSGNKIDFMIVGTTEWAAAQIDRSKSVAIFPNESAQVAAPEDVILGKLIYHREGGSDKHLRDIAGILSVNADLVDRDYIARTASQLGVEDSWHAVLHHLRTR